MKIREVLRTLRQNGWIIVRVRGSHRQLKHPSIPGTLTIAGHPSLEIGPKARKDISKRSGVKL